MNNVTNIALMSAAAAAFSTLSACGTGTTASREEAPLAGARIGAPFTLTDQDGKTRRWDDYKGKYRIVYFGYTYCPDICPVDLQRIMQGYAMFAKKNPAAAARVQPIFISVDPGRDTPAVLKNYVGAFGPRLTGLTGTPEQIAKVTKDFAVFYGKEGDRGGKDYLVAHSRTPYLFGRSGEPIALVPVDDPATQGDEGSPKAVLDMLDRWVK